MEKFYSRKDSGKPFEFVLAKGQVIKGWDMGSRGREYENWEEKKINNSTTSSIWKQKCRKWINPT